MKYLNKFEWWPLSKRYNILKVNRNAIHFEWCICGQMQMDISTSSLIKKKKANNWNFLRLTRESVLFLFTSECGSAEVEIDIRKVSSILGGLQTMPTSLEIHILHKSLAHIIFDFDDMRTLLVAPSAVY